jgi:toxin ParE1/3/4
MSRPLTVRLSRRAREDILDVWTYIAAENPSAADRILDRIERVLAMLAEHPLTGRQRPEVIPGSRSFAVSPYVIFYRVVNDESSSTESMVHVTLTIWIIDLISPVRV